MNLLTIKKADEFSKYKKKPNMRALPISLLFFCFLGSCFAQGQSSVAIIIAIPVVILFLLILVLLLLYFLRWKELDRVGGTRERGNVVINRVVVENESRTIVPLNMGASRVVEDILERKRAELEDPFANQRIVELGDSTDEEEDNNLTLSKSTDYVPNVEQEREVSTKDVQNYSLCYNCTSSLASNDKKCEKCGYSCICSNCKSRISSKDGVCINNC